ncbi:MAG: 50S ribosomal protein L13 [Nanoarchaeota archaeon]
MEITIDATNLILGRLCSYAAKRALESNKVNIINCENAVVSGSKNFILGKYLHRLDRTNPLRGPFVYSKPDRFVKRAVRGMLPYKQEKGKNAFRRVKCYTGTPDELSKAKIEALKDANLINLKIPRFIRVSEICEHLGNKAYKR